ncbi:cupredoxin domain-containing protein [Aspergillus undulatus]|uniref:cupredoxin domain-containing protein n=1 Tax=Aspergillus undulatus TaxID=1810928 RepID=UPI003CCD876D
MIHPPRVNMIANHIFPLAFALCTIATTINVEQTVALDVSETDGQVTHHVSVGLQGSPIFVPYRLNANIGDQILFEFHNLNHTLTQSSLDKPCSPIGGFDTGFNQYNPQNRNSLMVGLTVNSLDPQWFFCKQEQPLSHCHAGMVFALNPGDQMGTFLRNVRRDNSDSDLGTVSTDPLTSTLVKGSGTASPILSSTTIPLHGTGSTSATPGSTFTSGSGPTPAASGPVFTSGTASTHQHSHASAAGLITPVVVTTVTQTVGCTETANAISLKRSSSTAVFSSEGNASPFSPFAASLGFALGLAIIIVMKM